jgi:RHS repeat-associated protein
VVTNSGADLNGTTDFYLDVWREVEEHDGANALTQQYVYGAYIDEPLVLDRGGQRLFYHQDKLYSVFALTDTTGKVVEGYLYDAYGRQTVFSPAVPGGAVTFGGGDVVTPGGHSLVGNPYLFTGRRLDPETGLYYYRARYMDPVQGRFLSRDPVGVGAGEANLYLALKGNSLRYVDPLGRANFTPEELQLVVQYLRTQMGQEAAADLAMQLHRGPAGPAATALAAARAWFLATRAVDATGLRPPATMPPQPPAPNAPPTGGATIRWCARAGGFLILIGGMIWLASLDPGPPVPGAKLVRRDLEKAGVSELWQLPDGTLIKTFRRQEGGKIESMRVVGPGEP